MTDSSVAIPDEVRHYIDALGLQHRQLFDHLHRLILEVRPDAEVVFAYRIPMYKAGKLRVGLNASRPAGVTLTTTSPDYIDEFARRHPRFKTGKASIQFRLQDELPDDDIREVVRRATTP